MGEVATDGLGWHGDAWRPLLDEVVDMGETMVAGENQVFGDLGGGDVAHIQGFRADGPYSGDPGKIGTYVPLVGQVEPLAGADGLLDLLAGFECQQCGVANEQGGVSLLEHADGIGGVLDKGGVDAEKLAEQDFGVSKGTARSGVGGDGANRFEAMACFDDQLDGADAVERGDGAARNDSEIGGKGGDGDEAEVCTSGQQFIGAEGGFGVVETISLGKFRREWRVLEVPHERCGIEKVDSGYADGMG